MYNKYSTYNFVKQKHSILVQRCSPQFPSAISNTSHTTCCPKFEINTEDKHFNRHGRSDVQDEDFMQIPLTSHWDGPSILIFYQRRQNNRIGRSRVPLRRCAIFVASIISPERFRRGVAFTAANSHSLYVYSPKLNCIQHHASTTGNWWQLSILTVQLLR